MTAPALIRPLQQPVTDAFAEQLAELDAQIYQAGHDLDQIMNQPAIAATGWIGLLAGATVDWGPAAVYGNAQPPDSTRLVGVGGVAVLANVGWNVVQPDDNQDPPLALRKIAGALNRDHPTVSVIYDATTRRLAVTATTAGSAGNQIELTVGSAYQSFLQLSGATLSGGQDGQVRQQLDATVTAVSTLMLATDRMLVQGRTDHKEVAQALHVYPPNLTQQEAERQLSLHGYDLLCGKPLVRDGQHQLKGAIDLVNLLGAGPAQAALAAHASGSLLVVPVVTQQESVPYQTSCGTIFRDEFRETVLALNQGPNVVPAGAEATYYAFHLGDLTPTAAMVTRLQTAGFSAEQIGTMMNATGNAFNVIVKKIADPTILAQVATTTNSKDLTEVAFRNIDDWVWNATAADWQSAVNDWLSRAGGQASGDVLKALEMVNQGDIWPFGSELRNALDQVSGCLDQKLIDLFSWLVAKIEWFQDVVNKYLVAPVTQFANAANTLKAFVLNLFNNVPGNIVTCLLGDLIVNLLPQLNDLFQLVMLTVTAFVNSVLLVLMPIFTALSVALQPICLCSGVITGLLGHSVPGLECLPPLNIPLPTALLDLLHHLQDFLKLIPMIIGILTNALAAIFDALGGLLTFNIHKPTTGTCNTTSVAAMLASLAVLLGSLLAAQLLKDSGLCPSTDLPEETPTANPLPDGTPTGYCP